SDSDVKIVGVNDMGASSDSDISLEGRSGAKRHDDAFQLTEEINLDEEIRKQEEALKRRPSGKVKPKSGLAKSSSANLPVSPFELVGSTPAPAEHDSSDFDLTAKKPDEQSDFSLELPDESDQLAFGEQPPSHALQGPTSGINLANPVDAGISLEYE